MNIWYFLRQPHVSNYCFPHPCLPVRTLTQTGHPEPRFRVSSFPLSFWKSFIQNLLLSFVITGILLYNVALEGLELLIVSGIIDLFIKPCQLTL